MNNNKKEYKSGMIHFVISKSYFVFLIAIILGLFIDTIFNLDFLDNNRYYQYFGLLFMFLGTILIYWSQSSSKNAKKNFAKDRLNNKFNFNHGPYRYIHHPSYMGVMIISVGFGLSIGSLFSIVLSLISYFFIYTFLVKKEEEFLENKHGDVYLNYRKRLK